MQDLEGFKLFLAQRRGRHSTKLSSRNTYVQILTMLFREAPGLEIEQVSTYLNRLHEAEKSPSWINKIICVLHIWGEYKNTTKYKIFKVLEASEKPKSIMSDREIEDFLALPGTQMWTLYFSVLAYSGMRPGEVATLTTSSVDLGRGIFNADGKTGARPVPIAPTLLQPLTEYIKTLSGELLFTGRNGLPVSRESWRQQFENRIRKLGIKRPRLTAHSLRHSFITRMLEEDVNLFKVQKIVGHKLITTTEKYTHLTTKDIIKAIKKDPLARQSLEFTERFKIFREGVRSLLEDYTITTEEERLMLQQLLG